MRFLACASLALGLVAALHPRAVVDPALDFAAAGAGSAAPPSLVMAPYAAPVAEARQATDVVATPATVAARPEGTNPPHAPAALAPRPRRDTTVAATPGSGPPIAVRELAGPRAHAEAVAAALEAKEHEEAVAPLARLYLATFDRGADFEGLDHYVGERGRGTDLREIAEEFAASAEFVQRYGALANAEFIDRVWDNVFGGFPDSAQRSHWIAELEAGRMTRGAVMLAFSESAPFRAATSNEVFVTLAYAEALRSTPDARELARWVALLDAGHPRSAVIAGLVAGARAR